MITFFVYFCDVNNQIFKTVGNYVRDRYIE